MGIKKFILILGFSLYYSHSNCQDINTKIDSLIKAKEAGHSHAEEHKEGVFARMINFYKKGISPIYASNCAFNPSCSQFSKHAFETYNPIKALLLSFDRLTRCHPRAKRYSYKYNFETELCTDHP